MTGGDCGSDEVGVLSILAYIGGGLLAMGPMLQTYKMFKKKHTKDISMKWSLNHMTGLSLVLTYGIGNQLWPIVAGEIVEMINMLILTFYKIYVEKKFLRFKCVKDEPEILEIQPEEFKRVTTKEHITLSIEHEDLDDIMEKSNDDDNIFLLKFTKKELEEMLESINTAPNDEIDFKQIHIKLHDSDNEEDENISIVSHA
jgi:uncharacterized protein with PQ loop repeat